MSNSLEETLSQNEREKVTEIAEKADVQVSEVRRLVEEHYENHKDDHVFQQLHGDQDRDADLIAGAGQRRIMGFHVQVSILSP